MPTVSARDLMTCIQAIERVLDHNDRAVQARAASPADVAEENFMWEHALNRLGALYAQERTLDPQLEPLDAFSAYFRAPSPVD